MSIGESAREALFNNDFPRWVGEAYGASGLGVAGVAMFVLVLGAVGLFNWSESFRVPTIWLTLMTPVVALTLPVPIRMRLFGLVVTAVGLLFVAFWIYWQRT